MYPMPRGTMSGQALTAATEGQLRELETVVTRRRAWSGQRLGFLVQQMEHPHADRFLWRELESKVSSKTLWVTPYVTHLIEQMKEGEAPEVNLPDELLHEGD